jgi:CRP-like cAMP-binding protein
MSVEKKVLTQFLNNWPQLNGAAIDAIALEFKQRDLKRGELLLQAGKVADEYLFLEQGFIRSYLFDTEGNEITMNFYSQNEMVFEVASFFQRSPSQENFEATTDCTGWVLTYERLNHLFHTLPEFRDFGRAILVKGFISFKLRTLAMINKTAEERYELLLKSNPTIFQHASLKHIASYLGVTDTSLSRIRKSLAGK